MALDFHKFLLNCPECARERMKLRIYVNTLKLFSPKGQLKYVEIDLQGPLHKSARVHTHQLVISDRFTKLTKTVPLYSKQLKSYDKARAFAVHRVFCYGPQ